MAQHLARRILAATPASDPQALPLARQLLRDVAGRCVAARPQAAVQAALLSCIDQPGPCTVFGHPHTLGAEAAAFVNGVAAQGEDGADDAAVLVPALLAAAQRHGAGGDDLLRGIAAGLAVMSRLRERAPEHESLVKVLGAATAVGVLLELTEGQLSNAITLAAGLAGGSGRLQAGWAAQAGYRTVRLAMAGLGGGEFDLLLEGHVDDEVWPGLVRPSLGDEQAQQIFDARCAQGGLTAAQSQALAAALDALFQRSFIDTDALSV